MWIPEENPEAGRSFHAGEKFPAPVLFTAAERFFMRGIVTTGMENL